MAKENNEISDIVKKCKILLLDIEGTTTSISFVKDKLFPYAEENVKAFLESQWENEDVKETVAALRKQAAEDKEGSVEGLVAIPAEDATKDEQIEGLVNNVKWMMSADRKVGPLKQLQGLIWQLGYDKGDIKGHVYDDVSPALELWRATEGQKVYIYSSGSVQAQKLLFNKSVAGDMLPLIEGHFDTAVGAKQEAGSYAAIVEKIGYKAEEILFLTDIVKEAEAARASGLQAALVSREGNAPLPSEATALFPVIHSFEQLAVTNKRKPDPQVEEVPAKVPKTDAEDDVKTVTESEPESAKADGSSIDAMETAENKKAEESETMEVEETPVAETEKQAAEKDVPMEEAVIETTSVEKVVTASEDIKEIDVAKVETSQVVEAKAEEVKTDDAKVKMVDVATLTDTAVATKTAVDAATEPVTAEELTGKSNAIEESNQAETIAVENNTGDAAIANVTSEKEISESIVVDEVQNIQPSAVVSDKTEQITDDAPINESSTAVCKIDKPVESQAVDNSEAGPNKTNRDNAIATEASINGSDTSVTDDPKPVSVQNGVAKTVDATKEKAVEIVVEEVTDVKGSRNVPVLVAQPVEELGKKTDKKETENMETEADSGEKVETVAEPKETVDVIREETQEILSTVEVKDITDDKESLSEVTDIIDDVVPIVEEPSQLKEMEELQNAGDVLEKECDEILSKVQDVTNLDYMPVKPLHTIAEEMETENIDSNDIVDRILDTEMELSMKPEEIDLNVVEEIAEPKTDSDERIGKIEPGTENQNETTKAIITEETMEVSCDTEKTNGNKVEPVDDAGDQEAINEPAVAPMETEVEVSKSQIESATVVEDVTPTQDSKTESNTVSTEAKKEVETDKAPVTVESKDAKITDPVEAKVNGKTNGDANIKLNGNASNENDLKSRLTADTIKEKINGSNGDSVETENGQGDNKIEADIPDIKLKSVANEEVHTPIEQPVEA